MIGVRLAQLRKKINDQRAHLDELEGHMYVSLFVFPIHTLCLRISSANSPLVTS